MYREKLTIKKANPLAALYPTAKVAIALMYCVVTALLSTITFNGYALLIIPLFLVIPALFAASGIGDRFLSLFKVIFTFVAVIFVVQVLVLRGDVVAFSFGFINIYADGLQHAIVLCFLILNIAGVVLWLFQTSEVNELTYALEEGGMSHKSAFVILATFQMIDVLSSSSKLIMNAQQARGIETQGNMLVRAKAFFPMIVPLVVGSIMNTEERVLTLESKGFDVDCAKTHFIEVRRSGNEGKAFVFAAVVTIAAIAGRVALWIL